MPEYNVLDQKLRPKLGGQFIIQMHTKSLDYGSICSPVEFIGRVNITTALNELVQRTQLHYLMVDITLWSLMVDLWWSTSLFSGQHHSSMVVITFRPSTVDITLWSWIFLNFAERGGEMWSVSWKMTEQLYSNKFISSKNNFLEGWLVYSALTYTLANAIFLIFFIN